MGTKIPKEKSAWSGASNAVKRITRWLSQLGYALGAATVLISLNACSSVPISDQQILTDYVMGCQNGYGMRVINAQTPGQADKVLAQCLTNAENYLYGEVTPE